MNCSDLAKVSQLITILGLNPQSFVFRYLVISSPRNHIAFLVVVVVCRMLTERRGNGGWPEQISSTIRSWTLINKMENVN